MKSVALVEGTSDKAAVEALASRLGRNLEAEGVPIIAMGGATNVARYVGQLAADPAVIDIVGLCDFDEVRFFEQAFSDADVNAASNLFVCDPDLEGELIRAAGVAGMIAFIEEQGEGPAYRTYCKQPVQRGQRDFERLHRFFGTKSGRKTRYAEGITAALDLGDVPAPLAHLLERI